MCETKITQLFLYPKYITKTRGVRLKKQKDIKTH